MDHYVRSRQIELARSIESRKKVYFDTCFWITARRVVLEEAVTPAERKLLDLLRRGVRQGKLICPISESTFVEVMKQTDNKTRAATAALIDEMSLGVSLTAGRIRTATEIAYFFHVMTGQSDLYAMRELVWTKLSYALGYLHPTVPEFDQDTELRMQKDVFDELWGASLTEMLARIGDAKAFGTDGLAVSAAQIDADIKQHQANLVSFEQTYRDEIVGVADNCYEFLLDIIAEKTERAGQTPAAKGSPDWEEHALVARNLLVAAFTKPETRRVLRSMHIQACLHAGLRWNKGTKFVANHYFDFEHATAALAYCDAFFTEGFLSNLVNARHINLAELNGCRTTNSAEEAVRILQAL